MKDQGMIDELDTSLFTVTDSPEEAIRIAASALKAK